MEQARKSIPQSLASGRLRSLLASEYQILLLSLVWFLALLPFAPGLSSPTNIGNIFSNMLPLLVVAVGQTLVLLTGGIDLSATSIIALSSVSGALVMSSEQGLMRGSPLAAPAGVVAMLLVGAAVGWVNGLVITRFQVPPFIVTLTTMMFVSGLAVWMTKSKTIYGLPAGFTALGKGALFFVAYALLIAGAVALLAHVILSRTIYGRWLYATGSNARAARVSGVPVERTIVLAYVGSGLCAATASILYTGRLETGSPVLGQKILLDVIGATVIGGTSLFGGKGKVTWTALGVLFVTLIDNGLNMLGLSYFFIMMVKGGVILLAALLDVTRNKILKQDGTRR